MPMFAEILKTLPDVSHIDRLEIYDDADRLLGVIENRPGSAGSVAVYHAVRRADGCLDRNAAEQALHLYAEHTADAAAHPGKHPNIDRLLRLAAENGRVRIGVVPADPQPATR